MTTQPTHETIVANVAALQVEVSYLKKQAEEQTKALQEIQALLNQGRGGWRVLVIAGTIVGFLSGIFGVKVLKLLGVQ